MGDDAPFSVSCRPRVYFRARNFAVVLRFVKNLTLRALINVNFVSLVKMNVLVSKKKYFKIVQLEVMFLKDPN